MITSTGNYSGFSLPYFGRQRSKQAAATTLAVALVGLGACSKTSDKEVPTPSSPAYSLRTPPPSTTTTQDTPAPSLDDTFTNSRNTLLTELNSVDSPSEAEDIETDQLPGQPLPDHGVTSWSMGDHHYTVGWNFLLEGQGVRSIEATVENAEGQQFTITQNTHQAGEETILDRMTYTRPDGKNVDIVNPQDQNSADQLIDTMTLLSLAVSGSDYTPEEDWQQETVTPSSSPSPTEPPATEPSPEPSTEPSPTPTPEQESPNNNNNNNNRADLVISSFNLWGPHHGTKGHKADLKAVARSGAAMVGLQEAGEDEQILPSLRAMGPGWKFFRPEGHGADHTPIAWDSRVVQKIDSGKQFLLPQAHLNDGGKGGNEEKWAVWVKFRYKGQTIRLVNVHMIASRYASRERHNRYMTQIHRIADFVHNIPEHEIVILTGDFNSKPNDADLMPLRKVMVSNWMALNPDFPTHQRWRQSIDGVWIRPGAGAKFLDHEAKKRRSDHHQLLVDVAIPE